MIVNADRYFVVNKNDFFTRFDYFYLAGGGCQVFKGKGVRVLRIMMTDVHIYGYDIFFFSETFFARYMRVEVCEIGSLVSSCDDCSIVDFLGRKDENVSSS